MRVSVITPSFNPGGYLEQTLRSVAAQAGAEIEHIVIDGASTDGTSEVLERWSSRISWISEPDGGQSDAFNKGLARATGDVIGWLNADDLYLPGAVSKAVEFLERHPRFAVVYGDVVFVDGEGREFLRRREVPFDRGILTWAHNLFAQPASFLRREVLERTGGLDAGLHLSMDYDLFLKAHRLGFRFGYLSEYLAAFRFHRDSKSGAQHARMMAEHRRVLDRHRSWRLGPPWLDSAAIRALRLLHRARKTLLQYRIHGEFRPFAVRRGWYAPRRKGAV